MGVYMWARFANPPGPKSCPFPDLPKELIYVGEANDLNTRPLGRARHHRLAHYIDRFPEDSGFALLYVSVCRIAPFRPSDKKCHALRAFTRYLEARVGWEYARRYGKRPFLDYKKGKDEFALVD